MMVLWAWSLLGRVAIRQNPRRQGIGRRSRNGGNSRSSLVLVVVAVAIGSATTARSVARSTAVATARVPVSALEPAEQIQTATGVASGIASRSRFTASRLIVAATICVAAEELVQPSAIIARIANWSRFAATGFCGAAIVVAKPVAGEQAEALPRGTAAHRFLTASIAAGTEPVVFEQRKAVTAARIACVRASTARVVATSQTQPAKQTLSLIHI